MSKRRCGDCAHFDTDATEDDECGWCRRVVPLWVHLCTVEIPRTTNFFAATQEATECVLFEAWREAKRKAEELAGVASEEAG